MIEELSKLYKVSPSTGKTQIWFGWTEGKLVKCSYGQLNGRLQVNTYEAKPKNKGKINETTAEEQAKIELQAMYVAQKDNKHYHFTEELAKEAASKCIEPRKITNYKDRYTTMPDTLLTSIKENGSRACVLKGQLYSKIGRPEDIKVDHLRKAVEHLGDSATFDAEVYAFGLSLQRIRSAWLKPVKTDKEIVAVAKNLAKSKGESFTSKCPVEAIEYLGYNPNEDAPLLKFYVFDIPDTTGKPFTERVKDILSFDNLVNMAGISHCFEMLLPVVTESHEQRMDMLSEVCREGHEGLVHYDPDGAYEFGKRSTNTCKSKPRLDSEALVTGVEICKNGEGKLLLKACDALNNVTFKAMMKGTHTTRMYSVQKQFIGKWVTFEYEELSGAGKPTKPTVVETRLCDVTGEPLE